MNRARHKIAAGNWTTWFPSLLMAVLITLPCRGQTAGTNSPAAAKPVPPAYKFIAQRNIFNPNRYSGSGEGRVDPRRLAIAPGFSLVGTMTYEKGTFAFFDGTDSQYKKVLKTSGTIADYRVAEITPKYVKLEANANLASTNSVTLPVGMQLKRMGEGDWQLVAGTESYGGSSDGGGGGGRGGGRRNRFDQSSNNSNTGSASSAAPPSSSGTSSSAGGNASDILRRLMQQREREIQR